MNAYAASAEAKENATDMIDISNSKANKICDLLKYFADITADMPQSSRLFNARRVAGNLVKYINKKNNNYGKRKS